MRPRVNERPLESKECKGFVREQQIPKAKAKKKRSRERRTHACECKMSLRS